SSNAALIVRNSILEKPRSIQHTLFRNALCRGSRSARLALRPPSRCRLLPNHNSVKERRRFRQSLFGRHQAVFMLDREHIVVPKHSQRGNKFAPPSLAMPIAARAEDPRAVSFVGVALGIK